MSGPAIALTSLIAVALALAWLVRRSLCYYFCQVGPLGDGPTARDRDGTSNALDLRAPALQAPSPGGSSTHAVVSGDELQTLRKRGFEVEVLSGPHILEGQADRRLEDWWEFSQNMRDMDDEERRS